MSVIKTAAFSFRDFLESILPTFLAILLFIPCYYPNSHVDLSFIAAVLFGYPISIPISKWSYGFFLFLPYTGRKIKYYLEHNNYWLQNWDADKIFYNLTPDAREYMYLTKAYGTSFRTMSFYFVLFSFEQIRKLMVALWKETPLDEIVKNTNTSMFWGGEVNSTVLLIISSVLAFYLFDNYIAELSFLFEDNEEQKSQFSVFSEKCQNEIGGMAKSIWGKVIYQDKTPCKKARISLFVKKNKALVDTQETDLSGKFQFKNKFDELKGETCILEVEKEDVTTNFEIGLSDNRVPQFQIILFR